MKWKRLIFSCFILGVLSTGFATFAEESQSYANAVVAPGSALDHDHYGNSFSTQEKESLDMFAKSIADYIKTNSKYKSDLDKINAATTGVAQWIASARDGKFDKQTNLERASGESAIAAAVLSRVLEFLGYEDFEYGINIEKEHEYLIVTMDGQEGYADASVLPNGIVSYGKSPYEGDAPVEIPPGVDLKSLLVARKSQQDETQHHAESTTNGYVDESTQMLALINKERAKHGAAPLQLSTDLSKIAKYRAWELETSFSHTRPNGGEYTDFLGDKNIWSGENIAAGQVDVPSVFQSWMSSPGHRANMLNSHYRKLGFGHWQDENTTYKNYWVQIFTS